MNKHEQTWIVNDLKSLRLSATRSGVYAMQQEACHTIQKMMLAAESADKRDALYQAMLAVMTLNAEIIAHAVAPTVYDYTRFYQSTPVASTDPLSEASTL